MGSEGIRKRSRIVVDLAHCLGHDLGHGPRVFVVEEKVGGNSCRPGDREATKGGPLISPELAVMQAHVLASGLLSRGEGELMPIGGEVPKSIDSCGRAVRDDSLLRGSLPGGDVGG
jgi:hypothetical protein